MTYIIVKRDNLCLATEILSFQKIAFMVCSIVGASVFVPIVFSLGVVGSVMVRLQ